MDTVTSEDATAQLPSLVARAEAGEETIITRHGEPVARLVPMDVRTAPRVPGAWRNRVVIAEDFDAFEESDDRVWYGARECVQRRSYSRSTVGRGSTPRA